MLPADLVLVAVGLVPNIELAKDAGLAMGNGIVVDEFTQTSDPDILAIGDCTEHPLPFLDGQRVRLESVPLSLIHICGAKHSGGLCRGAATVRLCN